MNMGESGCGAKAQKKPGALTPPVLDRAHAPGFSSNDQLAAPVLHGFVFVLVFVGDLDELG